MAGTQTVTQKLAAAGYPEVEMVRGEGYHYFIFDDGVNHESESIMVMRFRAYTVDEWVAMGIEFADKAKAKIAERNELMIGTRTFRLNFCKNS